MNTFAVAKPGEGSKAVPWALLFLLVSSSGAFGWVSPTCTACRKVYFDDGRPRESVEAATGNSSYTCPSTLKITECSSSITAGVTTWTPEDLCPDGAFIEGPIQWSLSPDLGLTITPISDGGPPWTASIGPAGSLGAVISGSTTVTATGQWDGDPVTWTGTLAVEVGGCPDEWCSGAGCFASTQTANSSVAVDFALGRCAFGKMAGVVTMKEDSPSHALSTPACLKYLFPTNSECEVITNSAGLRQIKVPEGLANIVTNGSTNLYFVEFYATSQVGSKVGGLYQLSGTPLRTNRVENPDGATSTNKLRITETDGYVSEYEWRTNGWELVKGSGARIENKTSAWSDGNTILTTVKRISDTNALAAYTSNRYQVFTFGQRLVESVNGEGAAATTNSYTYYTNTSLSTTGLVRQLTRSSGGWEISEYGTNRLTTNKFAGFQNQAPTTNGSLCWQFEYSYGSNAVAGSGDASKSPRPRKTVEYLLGQEIARSYVVSLKTEEREIQCTVAGAAWNHGGNLVTITKWYPTGANAKRLWSIERPDGTMDIYDYKFYTNGSGQAFRTNIAFSGAPDATKSNIVDGTKTIVVLGSVGQLLSKSSFDVVSGIQLSSEVYTNFDAYNRPQKVIYLDGTQTWTDYGCCGPTTETNREGTVVYQGKDSLKRRSYTAINSITNSLAYDGAGNILSEIRTGSDGSKITNAVHTYDTAGRMLTRKDGLGNTTTHKEAIIDSYIVRTNIYPDGSTRIQTFYRDGQLAKVTGTAEHPVRYEYGVVQDDGIWRRYTKEIKLDGNGNDTSEVLTNFFDMVGRNYKTVYADGAKRESFYNTKGQRIKAVDPDGVTTLYEYDALGEVKYVVTDMDRDGTKDITGPDRIRQTVKQVTSKGASNVLQTRIYQWSTNGSSVSNLVSVSETRTDGLISWNSNFGVTNQTWTVYSGNGNRYETNTSADGSYTVTYFQHGQLKSVTRKDANGMQVSQTTYGYDAHGRQKTETDARNGAATYTYDNADRMTSITTPSPGAGQNAQITSYSYDYAGRRTRTVMPDGAASTNEYHPSGELKKTYGARAYPVEYKYDAQGRKTNMTTWQNYGSGTGAANTSWRYDGLRGFMTNELYADGVGPSYTYTPAGRLRTRVWARGVSTTYETNAVGEIVGVTYSDGTSNVVYNLDRLGRRTNIVDGAGTRYLTHTEAGLVLMETNASGTLAGVAVTNGYDSVGRRVASGMLTNGGAAFVHTYAYDSASRLTNVSDGTYNAVYSYLANSPLISQITYRSNTTTRMTTVKSYDYLDRLTVISSQPSASGESPISLNYALNDANQRTRVTQADGSYWAYEYDKLGQVTSGKKYWEDGTPVAGQQFEYGYDDIGNRASNKEGGDAAGGGLRSTTYSANLLNQYTNRTVSGTVDMIGIAKANATVTVNNQSTYRRGEYYQAAIANDNTAAVLYSGHTNRAVLSGETNTTTGNLLIPKTPQSFWYDFDGNTLSDGMSTNAWDAENRMSGTEHTTGVPTTARAKETWTFDGGGRWVQSVVSAWSGGYTPQYTNRFVWNDGVLLAVLNDAGVLKASVMRGIDRGGVGGVIAVNLHTNGLHFCVHDGNGNIVGLTKGQDGKSGGIYEYDPFGKTLRLTGGAAKENTIRFGGQYCDEISGGAKYLHRDYEPNVGRWRTRDPISEQGGLNIYAFVDNDPIAKWDYLGLTAHLAPLNGGVKNYSSALVNIQGDWLTLTFFGSPPGGESPPDPSGYFLDKYPWSYSQRRQMIRNPPPGYIFVYEEEHGESHTLWDGASSQSDWQSGYTRIVDVDFITGASKQIYTSHCCCRLLDLPAKIYGTTWALGDCREGDRNGIYVIYTY